MQQGKGGGGGVFMIHFLNSILTHFIFCSLALNAALSVSRLFSELGCIFRTRMDLDDDLIPTKDTSGGILEIDLSKPDALLLQQRSIVSRISREDLEDRWSYIVSRISREDLEDRWSYIVSRMYKI